LQLHTSSQVVDFDTSNQKMVNTSDKENGGPSDPSDARKRRKEIISSRPSQPEKRQKTASEKAKTKYQNRYVPDVPMTKEQEAEWRREARRKRNRESAAASRNKVRGRIAELEEEVKCWKKRYSMLLDRISALERIHAPAGAVKTQAEEPFHKPNDGSVSDSPIGELNQDISLKPSSSALNLALNVPLELDGPLALNDVDLQESIQETPGFHVIEMNSRPAVKITGETPHVSDIDSSASDCSEECNVSLGDERDREEGKDLVIGSDFFEQDEDDEIDLLLKEALLSL
jgi:hypothetical protein